MGTGYALKNCNVIYGDAKKDVEKMMTILIHEDGLIQEIGKSSDLAIPSHYQTIDLSGKYVMPGLINTHVHLFADGKPFTLSANEGLLNFAFHHILDTRLGRSVLKKRVKKNALTALHSGVTTMRSVGEFFYTEAQLRDEINANRLVGPNLLVRGNLIQTPSVTRIQEVDALLDSVWQN